MQEEAVGGAGGAEGAVSVVGAVGNVGWARNGLPGCLKQKPEVTMGDTRPLAARWNQQHRADASKEAGELPQQRPGST